jgi:hypothetical protein
MNQFQIPLVLAFLVVIVVLARMNLITSYLAGAAGLTISTYYQFPPDLKAIYCIICFLLVFFIAEDTDAEQVLTRQHENFHTDEFTTAVIRFVVFSLCYLLPIPKPFGYVPGIITVIGAFIQLSGSEAVKDDNEETEALLLLFLLGEWVICFILHLVDKSTTVQPYLAGIVVANLFSYGRKRKKTISDREDVYPFLNGVLLFIITLFCPGLSVNVGANALIAPGIYRILVASFTSAAIEGWALGSIVGGYTVTSKGVLSDLLLSPVRPNHHAALDGSGLGIDGVLKIFIFAIIPAIAVAFLIKLADVGKEGDERGSTTALSTLTISVLFIAQAIISSSFLSCIVIIPTTAIFSVMYDYQVAKKGQRSALKCLFIMIPMVLPT